MTPETLAVAGYAILLVLIGVGLDLPARTTHRRSEIYRTAGFTYHPDHDRWECPEGQHLWLHSHDHDRRLARYRANRHTCNRCPVKERCTDSDEGREIVRPLDPWPYSEAGRYHRGIALVPIVLAIVILPIEAIRHQSVADLGLLAIAGVIAAVAAARLAADLSADPANPPDIAASPPQTPTRSARSQWDRERADAPGADTAASRHTGGYA